MGTEVNCHGGLQKLLLRAVSSAPLLEEAASVGNSKHEQHLAALVPSPGL